MAIWGTASLCFIQQKVSEQKTCQTLGKRVMCDYVLLNSITAKMWNFIFANDKNVCRHRRQYKKLHTRLFNSFLFFEIVLALYIVKHPFLLLDFGPINHTTNHINHKPDINHKPGISQMGVMKWNNFRSRPAAYVKREDVTICTWEPCTQVSHD